METKMKKFNTTGTCFQDRHYMVDISERVSRIKSMVESGDYFCINRGRQYGKTTTLSFLKKRLLKDYTVFSFSFASIGDEQFAHESSLAFSFLNQFQKQITFKAASNVSSEMAHIIELTLGQASDTRKITLEDLDTIISRLSLASEKRIVVLIDEVDQASNYQSFQKLLGLLRDKYLVRDDVPTFHSVILAGVYNIKNLKLKIRQEGQHQYNSPWNIAADFNIDMSLPEEGIAGMLTEYENDHHTGMDIRKIARLLHEYTDGYPFLVSRLCQIMDTNLAGTEAFPELASAWTDDGFLEAVKIILKENNTLFDDMIKKIDQFPELNNLMRQILYEGINPAYNTDSLAQSVAIMFDFIKDAKGKVAVSNRLFETRLYNFLINQENMADQSLYAAATIEKNKFVHGRHLDMRKVLERFSVSYSSIYGSENDAFHEKQGRKLFMMYLSPIISGTGHFYVEAQTRDETRTDLIINYHDQQFIVEMKIWRGNAYNERGEAQLCEYLDYFGEKTGYMLSFCFNKDKKADIHTISLGGRTIIEAVV